MRASRWEFTDRYSAKELEGRSGKLSPRFRILGSFHQLILWLPLLKLPFLVIVTPKCRL